MHDPYERVVFKSRPSPESSDAGHQKMMNGTRTSLLPPICFPPPTLVPEWVDTLSSKADGVIKGKMETQRNPPNSSPSFSASSPWPATCMSWEKGASIFTKNEVCDYYRESCIFLTELRVYSLAWKLWGLCLPGGVQGYVSTDWFEQAGGWGGSFIISSQNPVSSVNWSHEQVLWCPLCARS